MSDALGQQIIGCMLDGGGTLKVDASDVLDETDVYGTVPNLSGNVGDRHATYEKWVRSERGGNAIRLDREEAKIHLSEIHSLVALFPPDAPKWSPDAIEDVATRNLFPEVSWKCSALIRRGAGPSGLFTSPLIPHVPYTDDKQAWRAVALGVARAEHELGKPHLGLEAGSPLGSPAILARHSDWLRLPPNSGLTAAHAYQKYFFAVWDERPIQPLGPLDDSAPEAGTFVVGLPAGAMRTAGWATAEMQVEEQADHGFAVEVVFGFGAALENPNLVIRVAPPE
jgi:hypothetical protein